MEKILQIFADSYIGLDIIFQWVCFIGTTILFFVWLVVVVKRLAEWLQDKFRKDDE